MFSNQAVLSACLITLLGLVSTRLILRRREQSNGAFPYLHQSRDRHGGSNPGDFSLLLYPDLAILSS